MQQPVNSPGQESVLFPLLLVVSFCELVVNIIGVVRIATINVNVKSTTHINSVPVMLLLGQPSQIAFTKTMNDRYLRNLFVLVENVSWHSG